MMARVAASLLSAVLDLITSVESMGFDVVDMLIKYPGDG